MCDHSLKKILFLGMTFKNVDLYLGSNNVFISNDPILRDNNYYYGIKNHFKKGGVLVKCEINTK